MHFPSAHIGRGEAFVNTPEMTVCISGTLFFPAKQLLLWHVPPFRHLLLSISYTRNQRILLLNLDYKTGNSIFSVSSAVHLLPVLLSHTMRMILRLDLSFCFHISLTPLCNLITQASHTQVEFSRFNAEVFESKKKNLLIIWKEKIRLSSCLYCKIA